MNSQFKDFTIVFFVSDINRTERFYQDVLGITLTKSPEGMQVALQDSLHLIFFEGKESAGRSPVVVFGLDEGYIDSVVEEIAKKGAEIVTPVTEAPGGWSADFLDPDGHVLSFYQSENLPRRRA